MNKTYIPHSDERYYFDQDLKLYGPQGLLALTIGTAGYRIVLIDRRYQPTIRSYHRAIAETFIPNPENKPCVNHIDGNKLNNAIDNLEWVTYSENTKHALLNNLYIPLKGEDVGGAKLTLENIKAIMHSLLFEHATNEQLAEQYGLHSRYISLIRHKHRWKHAWDTFYPNTDAPKSNQPIKLHSAKSQFTEDERRVIIKAVYELGLTNTQIQNMYGIERSNVSKIRHGKFWKSSLKDYFKSLETIPNGSTSQVNGDGNSKGPITGS